MGKIEIEIELEELDHKIIELSERINSLIIDGEVLQQALLGLKEQFEKFLIVFRKDEK